MTAVLAPRLNEIIRSIAPPFRAGDFAPSTPHELHHGGSMVVWSGASDGTIFADPSVNHAFRAWHDREHMRSGLGFSVDEEIELGRRAAQEIARLSGDRLARLVWLEIAGQALWLRDHGTFVEDQYRWTTERFRENP